MFVFLIEFFIYKSLNLCKHFDDLANIFFGSGDYVVFRIFNTLVLQLLFCSIFSAKTNFLLLVEAVNFFALTFRAYSIN